MALLKHFNKKATIENETGLSTNSNMSGGRFFKKDGTPNMLVSGIAFWERQNIYHILQNLASWKLLVFIFSFFIGINLLFAGLYLLIGLDHLGGMVANTAGEKFGEAFFFSAQTFTTVGYGRVNPIGFWASFTASFEALVGLVSFAIVTGLLYGRFAKPKAYIKYSKHALFAPYKNGVALMFRMVPYTKNYLVNVEVKVTMALKMLEDGIVKNKFYNVPLELSKANTLTANWTLVHVINEESPLYNLTKADIANAQTEILVFLEGFDESFSSTVVSRSSYTWNEFVYGAKFSPMYQASEDHKTTILYIDKLNDFEPAVIPITY